MPRCRGDSTGTDRNDRARLRGHDTVSLAQAYRA